jgi:hypothetical protein
MAASKPNDPLVVVVVVQGHSHLYERYDTRDKSGKRLPVGSRTSSAVSVATALTACRQPEPRIRPGVYERVGRLQADAEHKQCAGRILARPRFSWHGQHHDRGSPVALVGSKRATLAPFSSGGALLGGCLAREPNTRASEDSWHVAAWAASGDGVLRPRASPSTARKLVPVRLVGPSRGAIRPLVWDAGSVISGPDHSQIRLRPDREGPGGRYHEFYVNVHLDTPGVMAFSFSNARVAVYKTGTGPGCSTGGAVESTPPTCETRWRRFRNC